MSIRDRRTSEHVDAAALQAALPAAAAGSRVERMRAALHEAAGEWEAALAVLVQELGALDDAEAFADRLYALLVRPPLAVCVQYGVGARGP